MEEIKKSDHGLYVCQASNKHTTTNMTTFIVVKGESNSVHYLLLIATDL